MSSTPKGFARASLLGVSSVSLMVSALCAQAAYAADESADVLESVVVTGSRIQRRDYEANSPITTVDESLLKNSGTAAIETNLAKLPQFHAVQTPAQGGDIQPTATNTPGAATISLRGLGTNRIILLNAPGSTKTKGFPVSPAIDSAISVLPVPGGPHNKMPPGTYPPCASMLSGFSKNTKFSRMRLRT